MVDAVPKSPKRSRSAAPRTERPEVSGKSVGDTLAALLPEKLDVVARGGQESEYAYVVVDDGRGRSPVRINVQYVMVDAAGKLYADGETLPDGTRVATRQGPGEKAGSGVVMWTVDTLRPGAEGFRVVVSAFDTGDQNADATRDAPAPAMEQLRKIALSEEWDGVAVSGAGEVCTIDPRLCPHAPGCAHGPAGIQESSHLDTTAQPRMR
ncbi:hypothetical protein [Streptomyces sp. BK208]|uniref:hypothetical protein n=1 Tax=Streptomyces sp. BK208 TaxID=2512150 RepID=UPI001FBB7DFE|nr:hypothetical protein [Streptomyces sp. BK208]